MNSKNIKFAYLIAFLFLQNNVMAQNKSILGMSENNKDCYDFLKTRLIEGSETTAFVFTAGHIQYYTFGKVQKEYSSWKKKVENFSIEKCPTGRTIACNQDEDGNYKLPSLIIAEKQDTTLQITYLLKLPFEGNVYKEFPLLKQVITFNKDSAHVVNKDTVFRQPIVSRSHNLSVVNRIDYMTELQKNITANNAALTHETLMNYMNLLLTCTLAGYSDSEKLFLNLKDHLIVDGLIADIYYRNYNFYLVAKPKIKPRP